jgi:hypothetical protein
LGLRLWVHPVIVIVVHWGCMRPDTSGRRGAIVNLDDMLDLVGGRALAASDHGILRKALLEAAAVERYFLILSAYEPAAYARDRKVLLWRTQISTPIGTLMQPEAFPVLAACGAAHYGRPTPEPRFISVDAKNVVRAAQRRVCLAPRYRLPFDHAAARVRQLLTRRAELIGKRGDHRGVPMLTPCTIQPFLEPSRVPLQPPVVLSRVMLGWIARIQPTRDQSHDHGQGDKRVGDENAVHDA